MVSPPLQEQRFLLHNVKWPTYEKLLAEFGGHAVRITYDRGNLEFMSPSREHERVGHLLGRLVEALTEELGIPIGGAGSTTFRKADLDRGLEPDECYYIEHEALIRGKDELDLTEDPPPDLAIEVDITRSSLDRMAIYAALGVPELWRCDGLELTVYLLREDGQYVPSLRSGCFSFLNPQDLLSFLQLRLTLDETTLVGRFRAWIRDSFPPGDLNDHDA